MSDEIVLIWLAASAEVEAKRSSAPHARCRGWRAAVSAPTAVRVRSTSMASDLTWLAASDEAVTSVFWASRAPAVIASAVAVPAVESERCNVGRQRFDLACRIRRGRDERALGLARAGGDGLGGGAAGHRQRTLHVGRQRLDLAGCFRRSRNQRALGIARAGNDRFGGGRCPPSTSDRSTSAVNDLTWLAASVDAVTSVLWASRAPAMMRFGGGGAGDRQRALDVGGQRLDLVGGIGRGGDQRALRFARAGGDRFRGGGAGDRQRALDVGGQRLDLVCGIRGRRDQRGLGFAGAGQDRGGGGRAGGLRACARRRRPAT